MLYKIRHACLERLKTMRDKVLKNYLTPNKYEKLLKTFLRKFNSSFYQCCKIHGDRNIIAHRLVIFTLYNIIILKIVLYYILILNMPISKNQGCMYKICIIHTYKT